MRRGCSSQGRPGSIFWIVGFATFLITGAFVTAQLGRMFPEEGSLYVRTHKVLGPFWGFFAGFVAWWPVILMVFISRREGRTERRGKLAQTVALALGKWAALVS